MFLCRIGFIGFMFRGHVMDGKQPAVMRLSYRSASVVALVLTLSLVGCAVGPNYQQPAAPNVPLTAKPLPKETIMADGVAQHFEVGGVIAEDWWYLYRSPQLDGLIGNALANNPNLKAAQATLSQAEEAVRAAQGSLLPTISAGAGIQRSKASTAGQPTLDGNAIAPAYTLHSVSLTVSYMPDLFGGQRRQIENMAAQADYQRWQLEASYLTLTSNIVAAAVNEASLNAQIVATQALVADEQQLLTILQAQVNLGGAAQTQLLQQQAQLAQQEATLPPLEAQLSQAQNQLAAYAGQFPGTFNLRSFTLEDLSLPQTIPVSLPSALVAQRPDILAAAAQLHAATANVGVATANMLPQISLSADIGHEALASSSLFTPQSLLWNLVANATQPLFEGGTLTAQRRAAIYAMQAAAERYQATVVAAFENVADSLSALQYDADTLAAADEAANAAKQSLILTQAQYKTGSEAFSAVLLAEVTYQNALIADVKAKAARLSDTAALYQALGGGWWHRQDVANPCCEVVP